MAVYKPKSISGFPEWLPEERLIEQQWFDHIRTVFESYGFCSIETPSVEEIDVISAKGEVDKEIYVLERLHKDEDDTSEARLALHFDQTVPLARYVAQHFNDLIFPFKRYQMQRVWRGERPQAGRFREFYQCDIDVINIDALPLHFDAEMPAIIWETLSGLPGMENENIQLRISNRKILTAALMKVCQSKHSVPEIIRLIDKKEKIGLEAICTQLKDDYGLDVSALDFISKAINTTFSPQSFLESREALSNALEENSGDDSHQEDILFQEGITELETVMEHLQHLPEGAVVADLSIVRGLDYYTGTVYETVFTDDPGYGSICSGGRYDDLASSYINKKLPGVGISIGFSRLFDKLRSDGKFDTNRKSPALILMALASEDERTNASEAARTLRQRGYNVELYHAPQKIKKQLAYAERKGIPYVWFPELGEIKNMNTHEQTPADPEKWTPEQNT